MIFYFDERNQTTFNNLNYYYLLFKTNKFMNTEEKQTNDYGIIYLLAAICGVATALVVTGSIGWAFLGAILGLLSAGFFVNVVVKGNKPH